MLIYKWSPGTGYRKNKLHQNYMLEINISHWSRWTWENSFAACFLKCIHKAHHRLLSNLSGQILFSLHYVSLTATWIWGLLLIYTKTTLPHSGRAKTSAETWAPTCFAHQECSEVALAQNAAQAHKCLTRAFTRLNQGTLPRAKQKHSNENHVVTSRKALITLRKKSGFQGLRLCKII